jgi:hypothetical protein
MMDLRNYTVKEFAEAINENTETIKELMRSCNHLSYTNNPYENTVTAVKNSTVKEGNKEIVAKFVYTNLFNRPEHRFYTTRGYSVTLR